MTPAVALVGTSGYGRQHLYQLLAWHRDGLLRLAALVDLRFDDETRAVVAAAGAEPQWLHDLDLAGIDLVVVATPPHTHFALADQVLRGGCALYLEKPPVPLLSQLNELRAITPRRRAEVGFQYARSTIEAVEAALPTVGEVTRITAHGCLYRPDSYYTRSPWAGTWFHDGVAVFDGALFNPLAHVVHTALMLAQRIDNTWWPSQVEAELYAVHDITGDDTGVLRIRSAKGPVVVAVGTTAADVVQDPAITVHGTSGQVTVRHGDHGGPHPLLAALKDLDGTPDPLLDLDAMEPFVTVVNQAVELVGAPTRIAAPERLSGLIDRVVRTGSLFAELEARDD
ncbi:Gfo/Idh/MocA family oxidoreductase [Kribbella sandramycini]|uniref:Gfo/Idh/MocA family oxidoreductase n=1 Tax=Kribbella sandramycini TaxID=60450 RepID=A0A7Y4L4V5_9ACTN|nr:Gfo/Idh/MocA family oxidoreductase [Kribbella sandramycini]MBB6571140.1 putative dehydrogenase [Kribbella sandramycini]NOL43452.1 Gfo/Idh/MocA family oxidoreductase [Kribbella sandramycini]